MVALPVVDIRARSSVLRWSGTSVGQLDEAGGKSVGELRAWST